MFETTVEFIKSKFPGQEFIPLHEPRFYGNEKKYLIDCIDSTYVSSVGHYVDDFEKRLAQYTGAKYAVACVNGTAALHMAMLVAGAKSGDLVLTQALSFIATCNAISYLGAKPLFMDVDVETLGLSPSKLEEYLTRNGERKKDGFTYHKQTGQRISACVPMHTLGLPCRIDEIAEVCSRFGITLIEDAAESIGSYYRNRHTGTFGKLGTFSFNGNKTITCGGGGAIVTDDEALARRAKHLTTQAKVPHRWNFEHDEIGYNYRMPNLNAALLCAQMEELDKFIEEKRQLAGQYEAFFGQQNITFVKEPAHARSNYWLCAVLLKDMETRDQFLAFTNDSGVMTRPVWRLINKLPMFSDCITGELDNSEMIEQRLVNIPSSAKKA